MASNTRAAARAFLPALLTLAFGARDANAFCRTTTIAVPPDFNPPEGQCWDQGLPLWWRNACVGYSIHYLASKKIAYGIAAEAAATAFSKWTSATCPTDGSGDSRASIDVRDLGPANCGVVQYNSSAGNAHVFVFRDDTWPHSDAYNTLALTTVVFNLDTGELYDADMEINSTLEMTLTDPVPPKGYDFGSVLTHETGHFLGLAHSGDRKATMAAVYLEGSTVRRSLTQDDVQGICTVYPPDGNRAVSEQVKKEGVVMRDTCDPTPRNGFSPDCGSPPKKGCSLVGAAIPRERYWPFALGGALSIAWLRNRARLRYSRSGAVRSST